MSARLTISLAAAVTLSSLLSALPAHAGCYEIIGCSHNAYFKERDLRSLGCEPLADVRNAIYAENRYCFRTPKYISMYGNKGCRYTNAAAVPLNDYERSNVRLIRKVEARKGCR
jgi:hypothetical protein